MALSVGSGIGGQIALVVSGIVSARALGVDNRGQLALIYLMSLAVSQFASLGLPTALTYFVASGRDQTNRLAGRFARFIVLQFIVMTALHAGILVALFWSSSTSVKVAAAISLLTSGAQLAQQYGVCVLQGLRLFRSFNVLRLLGPAGYAVLAAICWATGFRSLIDITLAFTVANVAAGALAIMAITQYLRPLDRRPGPGDPTIGEVVRFGLSGLLGQASPLETFRIDQSIVGLFLSSTQLGIYVSAASFTNLPRFIAQSIGTVAYPYVARHTDERLRRATMWRFVAFSAIACAVIVGVLEVAAGWVVPLLFGNAFRAAIPVTRVLLVAGYVISLRRIIADASRGAGQPGAGTIAEVISWFLLVPGLLISVHFGLIAVGWALTAGAVLSVTALVVLLRHSRVMAAPEVVSFATAEVGLVADPMGPVLAVTSDALPSNGSALEHREPASSSGATARLTGSAGAPQLAVLTGPRRRGRLASFSARAYERLVYVPLGIAAIATAMLVVYAPSVAPVFLIVLLVVLGAMRVTWLRIVRVTQLTGLPTLDLPDDGQFRTARMLLYGGLVTSCWLRLRVHGLTVSDALFLIGLIWAGIEALASRGAHFRVLPPALWTGILLFVAGGTISTIANSHHVLSSFGIILRVFYLIAAWFWVGAVALRTRDQIWTALKCWVISAAVCGLWTLGQKYGHLPGSVDAGRYAGLADHVNDLGALTACALPPALALAYRRRPWLIAVLAIAAGLVLSGSIGAGIAAVVALGVGLVSRELARPTLIALAVGTLALVAISPIIGTSAITRFSTSTNASAQFGQDTFQTRVRTYVSAWHRVESSPILGTGLDLSSARVYDPESGQSFQVHNLFLGRLYDSGVLGCLGIIILVFVLGRTAWRLVLFSPDRYLALTLYAGFVAYFIDELSEPSLYKRYSLVPALLIVALRANVLRMPRRALPEARGGPLGAPRTRRRSRSAREVPTHVRRRSTEAENPLARGQA